MKVKCNTDKLMYLTKGKVYECEPHKNGLHLWVTMDNGERDSIHPDWLDVVPDTPQIEVGSEWVNEDGTTAIVKYASEHTVVFGEKDDCYDTECFTADFKPKPKNVTMYFYKDCKGLVHSYSEVMPVFGDYLFTREVEL